MFKQSIVTVNMQTALEKGGKSYPTALKVNFNGLSEEQAQAWIIKQVKVYKQAQYRSDEEVPLTDEILLAEVAVGGRGGMTSEQIREAAVAQAATDPKLAQDMIAKLQASLKAAKAA